MKYNAVLDKSKAFALKIIKFCDFLVEKKRLHTLSNQLLRSGTSIGANTREAKRGQTKPDFYHKLNIALKEADETAFWLEILYESNKITKEQFDYMYKDCDEIIALLVSITKTQKTKPSNKQESLENLINETK